MIITCIRKFKVQLILITSMRLFISFAKELYHDPIEKDVSPNETVEDLELIISLSIPEYNTYDLYYKNYKLGPKQAKLKDVIDPRDSERQIHVVKKGASVLLINQVKSLKDSFSLNISKEQISGDTIKKMVQAAIIIALIILIYNLAGGLSTTIQNPVTVVRSIVKANRKRK